jgi:tRNA A37 threonylcarbamoyladenosine dehydratase
MQISGVMLMEARNKKSAVGTISYMPTVFGCTVASVAIRDLYNRP